MSTLTSAGSFRLGDRSVNRMGYGAMRLAGPGVFGPPKDRAEAVSVLRHAVAGGVNHIDTSDFYGPHVTNEIIRRGAAPLPGGSHHRHQGRRNPGRRRFLEARVSPHALARAVHDNLRNLRVDAIDVVNFRIMVKIHEPSGMSIEPQLAALARPRRKGLVRHLGLSNATHPAGEGGAADLRGRLRAEPLQFAHRADDALIDELGRRASPMSRSFRSAVSRRSNLRSCRLSRPSPARRRCRWRSPGCFAARPISC